MPNLDLLQILSESHTIAPDGSESHHWTWAIANYDPNQEHIEAWEQIGQVFSSAIESFNPSPNIKPITWTTPESDWENTLLRKPGATMLITFTDCTINITHNTYKLL